MPKVNLKFKIFDLAFRRTDAEAAHRKLQAFGAEDSLVVLVSRRCFNDVYVTHSHYPVLQYLLGPFSAPNADEFLENLTIRSKTRDSWPK
jgi:hypothetical protein